MSCSISQPETIGERGPSRVQDFFGMTRISTVRHRTIFRVAPLPSITLTVIVPPLLVSSAEIFQLLVRRFPVYKDKAVEFVCESTAQIPKQLWTRQWRCFEGDRTDGRTCLTALVSCSATLLQVYHALVSVTGREFRSRQ